MIDISKYPNLKFHLNISESDCEASRNFGNDHSLVVGVDELMMPGITRLSYKAEPFEFANYEFPTIHEALEAANNLDGSREAWAILDQYKTAEWN